MTSIEESAFYDCSGLTSIVIPESVTSIGSYAFSGCSSLTSVTVGMQNPIAISVSTFTNRTNATLYVPTGSKAAYEATDYWKEFKEIVEVGIELPEAVSLVCTGINTFSSQYPLDFTEMAQLKAYIASGFSPSTGELALTRVTKTPAKEGLLIKGEAGEYEIPVAETDMYYSNLLKGVTTATIVSPTDGDYTNFILANGDKYGIGFYTLSKAGEIAAEKAYLQLPTSVVPTAEARVIKLVFDDEEDDVVTGILSVENSELKIENRVYNLNGQRVAGSSLKKGFYIVNGRTVLVR